MEHKVRTKQQILGEIACAVQVLDDNKAEAIRVLDLRGRSSITDYLVLATGVSEPHLRALRRELDGAFKRAGIELIGQEREAASGWLVADAFEFMVHLQTAEMRDYYRLDALWKDAPAVELGGITR